MRHKLIYTLSMITFPVEIALRRSKLIYWNTDSSRGHQKQFFSRHNTACGKRCVTCLILTFHATYARPRGDSIFNLSLYYLQHIIPNCVLKYEEYNKINKLKLKNKLFPYILCLFFQNKNRPCGLANLVCQRL